MTDAETIRALEACIVANCSICPMDYYILCKEEVMCQALKLIQRQQAKIDELTDRTAIRAIDRIHYNIAELNLIKAGFDIAEIKKRFRAEFEEKMELGIEGCINWADWLDSIASELLEEAKEGASNDR